MSMSYKLQLKHDLASFHSKSIVSLRYSLNGSMLASCSADKKVGLINSANGMMIKYLEGEHAYGINDCVWINDSLIATGSDDQTVKVWDVETNKVVSTFKGTKSFVYSLALNPVNRVIMSGGYDGSVSMFHLSSKEPLMRFSAHSEPIVSIACDQGGEHYATGAQDGLVRIWNPSSPNLCVRMVVGTENQAFPLSCVTYSPNSRFMLVSSLDSTHRLHSLDLLQPRPKVFDAPPLRSYGGHLNAKYSVHSALLAHSDGSQVADLVVSGSEDSKVSDWSMKAVVQKYAEMLQGVPVGPQFCPRGGFWLRARRHFAGAVLAVACNPKDGSNQIASAGVDGSVKLWSVELDDPVMVE